MVNKTAPIIIGSVLMVVERLSIMIATSAIVIRNNAMVKVLPLLVVAAISMIIKSATIIVGSN